MSEKTNLLFVLTGVGAGGSERVVLELARHLDPARFRIDLAFFAEGPLHEAFSEVCSGVFRIRKKEGFDPRAMSQLGWIVRKRNIDVVSAHHYMCFFYSFPAARLLNRRRLFYTEHSVPEVLRISGGHARACAFLFRETDGVIGVSKEITDAFREKFPASPLKFLSMPNSVDLARFAGADGRERVREELSLLPGHFVIGTVANFKRVKNHACLIRAFAVLSEKHPEARLVLAGRGDPEDPENTEQEVGRLIGDLGLREKVVVAGYRNDVANLLRSFDVFCLPSFSEGLPMSLLEAMAARLPVVGSNVRGIREVIQPMQTGLLFPSNDDARLAECLQTLAEDARLRLRLADDGHGYVSEKHGLRQWVAAYERLLDAGKRERRLPLGKEAALISDYSRKNGGGILYLAAGSGFAGVERYASTLLHRLTSDGDVDLACGLFYDGPLREILSLAGIPVIRLCGRRNLRSLFRLVRYLRENNIELLHFLDMKGILVGGLAGLFCRKTRTVATVHGLPEFPRSLRGAVRYALSLVVCRFFLTYLIDRVIFVSNDLAHRYKGKIDPARTHVIHNGVEIAQGRGGQCATERGRSGGRRRVQAGESQGTSLSPRSSAPPGGYGRELPSGNRRGGPSRRRAQGAGAQPGDRGESRFSRVPEGCSFTGRTLRRLRALVAPRGHPLRPPRGDVFLQAGCLHGSRRPP